ncbi:MAG: hypothetical protein GY953_33195, partial [bacterium]|nr:hypothetical protein [bacterium]
MRSSPFVLSLVVCAVSASGFTGQADLLSDADAWSGWAARPEIEPRFQRDRHAGQSVLAISGGGNPDSCGCWQRDLPALEKGRRFLIEAAFQAETVDAPAYSVLAFLTRGGSFYRELDYTGRDGEWSRMSAVIRPEEDLGNLSLRLCLAWSSEGMVRWSGARLRDVTDSPVKPRLVRLAAISGKPRKPASPTDCIDFYCDRLDAIGPRGADLVTLGDTITVDRLPRAHPGLAEPIPGPST